MIIKILTTLLLLILMNSCSKSQKSENNQTAEDKNSTSVKSEKIDSKKRDSVDKNNSKEIAIKKSILTIKTVNGKEIHIDEAEGGLTFQEYKDKNVFVIFFGYRCPPCLQEIPHLISLMNKKYSDLEVIAIEVQGLNREQLKGFVEDKGINYTVALGRENNSVINYIASRARWQGSIPFFISFNKKGEVKFVHIGALSEKNLEAIYRSKD